MLVTLTGRVLNIVDGKFDSSKGETWYTKTYQILTGYKDQPMGLEDIQIMERTPIVVNDQLANAQRNNVVVTILVDISPNKREGGNALQCRLKAVDPVHHEILTGNGLKTPARGVETAAAKS